MTFLSNHVAARLALALACVIAGLSGLSAAGMVEAQAEGRIEIVIHSWLCPAGYAGADFATDCTGTPDAADVNLSVWWGKTGGEGPGRHFAETTPTSDGAVAASIPLPAGESTTVLVDNRFSQTENPPIGGAVCSDLDNAGQTLDGLAFDDYGALSFEAASPADLVCDIYLVPDSAGQVPIEAREGSPGAVLNAEEQTTADTAIALSELEAAGNFDALYNQMHPEARAIVPRAAVVGWFTDQYAPQQPGVIAEVTGVEFVDWTWPVTGKTYPHTAEVSYVQPFGPDGEEMVEGTVRLVEVNDEWAWFFGRDAAFVDEQIAAYAPDFVPLGDGQIGDPAPWGIATAAAPDLSLDQVVAAMPTEFAGYELSEDPQHNNIPGVYSFATESMHYVYDLPAGDASASVAVNVTALPADLTVADALPRIEAEGFAEQAITGDPPPFEVTELDYAAEAAYLIATEESEQAGPRSLFVWGPRDGHTIVTVWAPDDVELELAVDAIVAALAGDGSV
jgi:hypothetical protein